MRVAYFDCYHGAAGDMMVGALIDAGLSLDRLREELTSLGVGGYTVSAQRVSRGGLSGTHFSVRVEDPSPPPRHLGTITEIIGGSTLSGRVKDWAKAVFTRLGRAESEVHGIPLEKVHFHEVGAIDSLVDVVGTLIGLELMGIERVYASSLTVGRGTVETAHGLLPVPAPATARLIEGFPVREGPSEGELLTPTAAALLTSLSAGVGAMPAMRIERTGYGAGTRDTKVPNLLRVFIGDLAASGEVSAGGGLLRDEVVVLETNIDNMSPEVVGYVYEQLFAKGALDVYAIPIGMKKSRPGVLLGVIAPVSLADELAHVVLRETTSIGVRAHSAHRWVCPREVISIATPWGPVRVKVGRVGEVLHVAPEYEDCRALALSAGVPLRNVQEEARTAAWNRLRGQGAP